MEDQNQKIQDIEMGEEDSPSQPVINNYQNQASQASASQGSATQSSANQAPANQQPMQAQQSQPMVNPAASAPPVSPSAPNIQPTQANPTNSAVNGTKPTTPPKKPTNPAAKRRAILGCLGGFFILVLIFFIVSFVFISQAGLDSNNPIAKLLGLDMASFINGLITFINIVFLLVAIVIFVITMVGLIKASTAKKEDKESKKKGIRLSIISGIFLIVFFMVWLFAFAYLDGKRINTQGPVLAPIVTTPEEVINLTAPITIKFDASHVPINSKQYQIVSYAWDFGDETKGTGMIVSHLYEDKGKDGRFDVILLVTRKDRETGEEIVDTYSELVTIANQALTAVFKADPLTGEAPLKVKFDASESFDPDGNIDSFEWDFDDDGEFDDGLGVKAEYEFEKIGKYTVSLRVTTKVGEFEVAEQIINVTETKEPVPVITITDEPDTFIIGRQYIFKSDESTSPNGKIDSYEWDFGDGSKVQKTKTVSHTFTQDGTYEVSLIIVDEQGKEGEVKKTIVIGIPQGRPTAVITTDPSLEAKQSTLKGQVPFIVAFDSSKSTDSDNNIVDVEWDFDGDGEADDFGDKVVYTFKNEGFQTVTLTVIDADGNEGKATLIVDVEQQGILVDLKADKIEGNVPLTVSFDASGSTYTNGQITSYKWDFGDKTSPKLGTAKITHKYDSIGTYQASVEVIGSDNTKATKQISITVREIPLFACFVSVFEEGPAPLETTFDPGCSTGTIKNFFWDFGDGNTSTNIKPNHTYTKAGDYTVRLETSDVDNTISTSELQIKVTQR